MQFDIKKSLQVACPLAYHGIAVNADGSLLPCCQYTDKVNVPIDFRTPDRLTEIRHAMHQDYLDGRRHEGCQKCYREEDLGRTTLRTLSNHMVQIPLEDSIQQGKVDPDNIDIRHIEMRLGNLCNLKCMMCWPTNSSSVAVERLQNREKFLAIRGEINPTASPPSWWETPEFEDLKSRIFPNVRWINFTGGEPMMIPEVIQWLDNIKEWAKGHNVAVAFNTNLTKLSDEMLSRLARFYPLTMMVSLEGVGAHNDYVRYPSIWSEIDHNMDRLLDLVPTKCVGVNHTFQHASAYSLPDLATWTRRRNIDLKFTMVQGYKILTLESVPPNDLIKFQRWAESTQDLSEENQRFVLNAIASTQFNMDLYREFRKYVAVLDDIRGTSWNATFQPSDVSVV